MNEREHDDGIEVEVEVPVSFRIELELLDELRARARANERSLSGEIRIAIRDHLEREEEVRS